MWREIFLFSILFLVIQSEHILGSSPETQSKFIKKDGKFQCFNGNKIIPFERVNDDYCDCPDGSDEPGTNACSHLENIKFYCKNVNQTFSLLSLVFIQNSFTHPLSMMELVTVVMALMKMMEKLNVQTLVKKKVKKKFKL
jgi:hypothetical protein